MARKTTSKATSSKRKTSQKDDTEKTETGASTAPDDSGTSSAPSSETSEGSAALSAPLEGEDMPETATSPETEKAGPPEASGPADEPADKPADPEDSAPEETGTAAGDTPSDESGPWGNDTATSSTADDTVAASEDTETAPEPVSEPEPEAKPEPKPEPTPPPARTEQVVVRKGGFVPMLLGGVAAGAIGFGVAYYLFAQPADTSLLDALRSDTDEKLQSQSDRLDTLTEQLGAGTDLSALEQGQSDLQDTVNALSDRITETRDDLSALSARVDEIETRPLTEGASEAAAAAYEAELEKLQQAMAEQRAEIEKMISEAQQMEQTAEDTAQATMRRAALSRIQTALDAGGSYASALTDLKETGMEVPEVLSRTADEGVATLTELKQSFPDAARAALAAAREAALQSGETDGLAAFLRTQLGVRSLEPRPGDDPDAILSRAEAAATEGRLTDALAEIEALPEVARAELSDWAGRAARRLEAVAAAQELSEELN